MNLFAILSNIEISDVLDIFFISFVAYQLYVWFSGTKAFKALIGIVVLSGVYILAESWGLFLTTWVFQILWQVFVILLIILFQKEIRQMLERFNPLKKMGYRQAGPTEKWVTSLSNWTFDAARKKTGALIIFERSDLIFDLITKGVAMECDPVPEILNSIFIKESPLHDGAALISNGKILKTSCFLPLTVQEDLPKKWGTRHRAALGLTEQSDACALIISEERGEVSFAMGQTIEKMTDADQLAQTIADQIISVKKEEKISFKSKIKSWFIDRYPLKLAVFLSVFVLWLALAGQQNFEKQMEISLDLKNIPGELVLDGSNNPVINVRFRGLRKDVSLLSRHNISAALDLYTARPGTHQYPVNTGNLVLPNDRIHVVDIYPAKLELTFKSSAL